MLRGLYSSATSLDALSAHHEVIARNLAHVNVPGFRRNVTVNETFEAWFHRGLPGPSQLGTRIKEVTTDFTAQVRELGPWGGGRVE